MIKRGDKIIADILTKEGWEELKKSLDVDDKSSKENWQIVWDQYYKARIQLRYLNPMESIVSNDTFSGEGFSIVAIICSLMEMLESFEQGKEYVYSRDGRGLDENTQYYDSGRMFKDFLVKRVPFCHECTNNERASEIYKSIRCGILHEARTKNGWKINVVGKNQIFDFPNKILCRESLRAALDIYFNDYRYRLLNSKELKNNFIRRVDSLILT